MTDRPVAVHVRPTRDGLWQVLVDDGGVVAQHSSATEAERTALALARGWERTEVFLHDAYHRRHNVRRD